MVIGGDSHSEGCGFESQCRMLDGHDIDLLLKLYCLFEKTKKTKKRPGSAHYLKNILFEGTVLVAHTVAV